MVRLLLLCFFGALLQGLVLRFQLPQLSLQILVLLEHGVGLLGHVGLRHQLGGPVDSRPIAFAQIFELILQIGQTLLVFLALAPIEPRVLRQFRYGGLAYLLVGSCTFQKVFLLAVDPLPIALLGPQLAAQVLQLLVFP